VLFTIGFGVGAAFGSQGGRGLGARARTFFTRNPPLIGVVAGLLASPAHEFVNRDTKPAGR
jgi:hypothetical protein